MLEIRICPETPSELQAALQLLQTLANMKTALGQAGPSPTACPTPVAEQPASTAEDATDAEDIVSIEFSPASGESDPTYSAQQVLEALQGYARENGAAALKEVLDRFGARRVSDIKPQQYAEVMSIARGELA